ncbi:MAG: alpha/beta fold hydrolase [Patescibacteria group bacterium]|nr:lysophospholipase [Patescibacteria group bacterium]MBU2508775.1 lysophospholipase [Patescibacteria group bacterium]
MEKLKIKNRKDQTLAVLVDEVPSSKGLAVIMHGLAGFKEQPHIQAMADAFIEKGITVVRFDTTNTFGESDGNLMDATTTQYLEDLEDVIKWAKDMEWYKEPFYLVGHSLGGLCVSLYASENSKKVTGLIPVSTVVSGKLNLEILGDDIAKKWEKLGFKIKESKSKPGIVSKLNWEFMKDLFKYDLMSVVDKLNMPALLIAGEFDRGIPPKNQKILFDALQGQKEMHIIKGAGHNFRAPQNQADLKQLIEQWIDKTST